MGPVTRGAEPCQTHEKRPPMVAIPAAARITDAMHSSVAAASWFAAYTTSNHEKKVARELERRSVEYFLPLYTSVRRWSDRLKEVQLPLFPGYVFVRLAAAERLRVLQVPGVANIVGFGGTPTAIPEAQIEPLRRGWSASLKGRPHPYLTVGRRVRVVRGPLIGAEGILLRRKNVSRLVLSLDPLQRSVAVEVDGADVEPIGSNPINHD